MTWSHPNPLPLFLSALLLSPTLIRPETVKLIKSDDSGVILQLLPYEVTFEDKGEGFVIPKVQGFGMILEPGRPQLPIKGVLVGVPPDANLRVVILDSSSVSLGYKEIYPSPQLSFETSQQGLVPKFKFFRDQEIYSADQFYPPIPAVITSVKYLRHQRVARLELHPLQYNPVTKELRKFDKLKVAIIFRKRKKLPYSKIHYPDLFENIYKRSIINYPSARGWRSRVSLPKLVSPHDWYDPTRTYYKLFIDEDGIYRLDHATLDSMGIDLSSIDPRTFKIYNKGQEIPLYVKGERDGRFDEGDYLEFYGEWNHGDTTYYDPYTDTNVYWLTWGGEPGLRMKTRGVTTGEAQRIDHYIESIHLEEDEVYYDGDTSMDIINTENVSGEGWVWRVFFPGQSGEFKFLAEEVAPTSQPCSLRVRLRGTTIDPQDPDHHAQFSLNGIPLGEIYFDDREEVIYRGSFPPDYLREGENKIKINSLGDTGAELDQFYLDWIEVDYPRSLVAKEDNLTFALSSGTQGAKRFYLYNFLSPEIELFELKNKERLTGFQILESRRKPLEVISAGFEDGNFIQMRVGYERLDLGWHRGHNLVVLDQNTGQILAIRSFDTFRSSEEADSMAAFIQGLPEGRVVLAGIRDEGSRMMTEAAYRALESLGSQFIREVGYRDSWAMIGRKGAPIGSVPEVHKPRGTGRAVLRDTLFFPEAEPTYEVGFQDTIEGQKRYLAAGTEGIKRPSRIQLEVNSNLRSSEQGADYIIITHKNFMEGARRLAHYRESHNGFRVQVVDVEDIYDEFNFGLIDPRAIRDFLIYAFDHWTPPPPAFVLLLGDASWDFKGNLQGSTKPNFVPSYGHPVSDNWFVCLDGPDDFLPDMCIGRLPVEDQKEAEHLIDKIIEYENSPSASWKKNILFITGGFDTSEQTLFINQSESLIQRFVRPPPASCNPIGIHKTSQGLIEGEKREDILQAFKDGLLWVNFIGHAGSRTWDLMLNNQDIEDLQNQGRYPFITSMTCHTARFAHPRIASFGENFLKAQDKGAIAFWGSTGWGFVFQDYMLLNELFPTALVDTVQILGEATTIAKINFWRELGGGIINISTIHSYTLLGDPATDLALPERPDLALRPRDVVLDPPVPTEADSLINIKIKIHNFGLATRDSLKVDVIDISPGLEQVRIGLATLPPIGLMDSLIVPWRVRGKPGRHRILVELDPFDQIQEEDEENNALELPVEVYIARMTISRPQEFQVVNTPRPVLQVNNPQVPSEAVIQYFFEIDTTDSFNSPFLIASPPVPEQPVATRWQTPELQDGLVYFWRCRPFDGSHFGDWTHSSFAVDLNSTSPRWSQSTGPQFRKNTFEKVQLKGDEIGLQIKKIIFQVRSAGFDDGNYVRITVNGKPVIRQRRGHNVAVFDHISGKLIRTGNFDTYRSYKEADQMAEFIEAVGEGDFVLVGIKDEGSRCMTERAYQALESIGSKLCREVEIRDSWAIIGRKGAPIGSVPEELVKRYQGVATVQDTLIRYHTSGSVTSPPIGPANGWGVLSWTQDLSGSGTDITLEVLGLNKASGRWTTLTTGLSNSSGENLSFIDPVLYPQIKLKAHLTDDDGLDTPLLKGWSLSYQPVADPAIGPGVVSISPDTVLEGEDVHIRADVYNIGMTQADSVLVRFYLSDPEKGRVAFHDEWVIDLTVDSFQRVETNWNTAGARGSRQILIEIDPEDRINELYEGNNSFTKRVFVLKDTLRPEICITFDGLEIISGDYVSSRPEILITIRDNSPLAVEDTSQVQLTLDGRVLYYTENPQTLQFIPNPRGRGSEVKAQVRFTPELSDGDHLLEVVARDATGNSLYSRVDFRVLSELKLLRVLNYPNPFASETSFTYILTQPADQVSIKIYTLAGRLIRKLEGLPGFAGFNHFLWDGRDQDGDPLANGVYLYKVIAKSGDQQVEVIEKLVVMR